MRTGNKRALIFVIALVAGFAIGSGLGFLPSVKPSEPRQISAAKGIANVREPSANFATNDDAAKALLSADHERHQLSRAFEVLEIIRKLNAEQTAAMVARVYELGDEIAGRLLPALLAHWVELDPHGAKEWVAPFVHRIISANDRDQAVLYAWARANPEAMIEEFCKRPHSDECFTFMITAIEALPERDLDGRLDVISNLPAGRLRERVLRQYLDEETQENPQMVLGQLWRLGSQQPRWLRENALASLAIKFPSEAIGELGALVSESRNDWRSEGLLKEVVSNISRKDPKAILDWLAKQPESVVAKTRGSLAFGWARKDPLAALNWAVENNVTLDKNHIEAALQANPKAVLEWIRKRPANDERDGLLLAAAECTDTIDTKETTALFNELPAEAQTRIARIMGHRMGAKGGAEWTQWLDSLPQGSARQQAISVATMRQVSYARPTMESIENQYRPGPDRDAALHGSAVGLAGRDLRSALEMARTIQDGNARESALWEVAKIWSYADPGSAAEWIESTADLGAETKTALIRQLHDDRVEYRHFDREY